ncbi:MAG: DUF2974 domain-containing protein [Clostridia bacterium]|nr:DUF2974 domain-containing protein [Clostridia bacterium]
MANIFDYLEWRCDVPFAVDPFNEVDNLVLAELVYTDFRGIVSMDGRAVPLRDACDAFFQTHTQDEIRALKSFTAKAPLLMEKMLCGARFRDVKLCWYLDETDAAREMQFAAVTFLLPDESAYIAFRGTDGTLVGWREDFNLSFLHETEGQRHSAQYLDRVGERQGGALRVGGHSKGGNMAVFAAARCKQPIQDRVLAVYSNDGPGFHDDMLRTEGYRRVLPKLVSIVPDTSIIGVMLSSLAENRVVKSVQNGILQHDGFSWEVLRNRFVDAEQSDASRWFERFLSEWLLHNDEETRSAMTQILFTLFESTGADSFREIGQQKWKSAEAILAAMVNLPRDRQKEALSFLQRLGASGGQTVAEYISSKIHKQDGATNP